MNKIFICLVVAVLSFQCKSSKPEATSQATLLNTYWKLADVNGNPVITPENGREAHIILTNEQGEPKLKGFAGCNSLGGSYTLDKEKLKFLAITTKMMCDPERMKVEDYLLNALNTADSYSIEGETLELLVGDTSVADFKAVYLN